MYKALQTLALLVGSTLALVGLVLGISFSVAYLPTNVSYQTTLNDFKNDLQALGFEPAEQSTSQNEAGETVMVTTLHMHGCGVEVVRQIDQEIILSTAGTQRIEVYAVRMSQRGEDYAPYVSPRPNQVQEFLTINQHRYSCYV